MMKNRFDFTFRCLLVLVFAVIFTGSLFAGSATWGSSPGSGDWTLSANWTPATVPNASTDTATFATSNITSVSIGSSFIEVNSIVFNSGASAFTITVPDIAFGLVISGVGITNNSGIAQNFVTQFTNNGFGQIEIENSATAGQMTTFTISGLLHFRDMSTAAGATIVNNATAIAANGGGGTVFFDNATAGNASITNNGGAISGGSGGDTVFTNSASAGNSTITNNAATVSDAFNGGTTAFFLNSTAGSAQINNNGGAVNGAFGGVTQFSDSSTASSATFNDNGSTASGARSGGTVFLDTSSAGSATINNYGGTNGGEGGTSNFTTNAKGGSATITNFASDVSNGSSGGSTDFTDFTSAEMATIENKGAAGDGAHGGSTAFEQQATAGSSHITNDGAGFPGIDASGRTFFEAGPATAGNSTIDNLGGNGSNAFGGQTFFQDSSNAGTAHINNRGSSVATAGGGDTTFQDGTSAANAIFVSDAGTTIGAGGGRVDFFNSSNAGHGNFTTNGAGPAGGTPGVTDFHNASSGDHGTFVSNGGTGANAAGGQTEFFNSSFADNATLTANAGTIAGAFGAFTAFWDTSAANSATLIANGGPGQGGGIFFFVSSTGDTSRVEVFGNGFLDISDRAVATPNVTVGSIEGTGNVFLGSHNLSVGSNNLSTIFSGVIQDGGENGGTGGSLTKIGTGALTLSGDNTFTGQMTVNAGTLIVNSDFALGAGNTLLHDGTLKTLDNTPQEFLVGGFGGGNYTQNFGTIRFQIGGLVSGVNSDEMTIFGTATLSTGNFSSVFIHQVNNFSPMRGDTVRIVATTGGVVGQWDSTPNNTIAPNDFPGLLQPYIIYDPNNVFVEFLLGSFNIGGLTPNQKSVAFNLNNAANDPAAAPLINFLALEPLGALPHDYDLIAPEELAAIYEISISSSMVQNNNLQRRMDDIRAGSNGFCANGFTPQVSGKDVSKDAGGKVVLDQKQGPDVYVPTANNRWGVFINGTGDFVNVGDRDSNAPGYDITTGEFTLGVDYRVCDNFAIGIDGGYSSSRADLVANGRIDTDGGKIGAYATWFGKGFFGSKFYVDGTVGGGLNNYDTRRTGLQNILVNGDTEGTEFNAMISYGSDWTFGCFNIGTWSSVQFTNVNIDEFTETGSLAPLIIEDQDENSFRTTTGVHASYDIKAGHVLIRPEVRAAYQHEYCDSAYQIDSQLASGAGGIFRVRGPRIGRDAALVDAGVNVQWNNRLATYVYYDGVLGRNNYDNNAVSGGFRIGF